MNQRIYKKAVKKHEEVWAEIETPDGVIEGRVRVCVGNSNYGRFYVKREPDPKDFYDEGDGIFLSDEQTAEAVNLLKEIWAKNKDNNPFGY